MNNNRRKNDFKKDLKKANKLFLNNKDYFIKKLKCIDIYSIEDMDNNILNMLDISAGVDLLLKDNYGLKTIANRIQQSEKSWDSFTIRYSRFTGSKTEFEKRMYAIENNYMYPTLTIQSYINKEGKILNYSVIETKKLYKYVKDNFDNLQIRETYDGNKFLVIPFSKISHLEYKKG